VKKRGFWDKKKTEKKRFENDIKRILKENYLFTI